MTVTMAKELEMQSIKVLPGWKLCAICYQKVQVMFTDSGKQLSRQFCYQYEETAQRQSAKRYLKHTLDAC